MVEACESAIQDGGRGTKAAVLDSRRSKLIAAPTGPIRDIGVLVADEASMFATMWDQIGGEAEAGCGQAPLVSDHQKWAPGARLDDRPVGGVDRHLSLALVDKNRSLDRSQRRADDCGHSAPTATAHGLACWWSAQRTPLDRRRVQGGAGQGRVSQTPCVAWGTRQPGCREDSAQRTSRRCWRLCRSPVGRISEGWGWSTSLASTGPRSAVTAHGRRCARVEASASGCPLKRRLRLPDLP